MAHITSNICRYEVQYDLTRFVGAGRMAKVHAEAISAAGARLVTVFDVAEGAAVSFTSWAGASVARTAEEARSHPEVTAVLVARRLRTQPRALGPDVPHQCARALLADAGCGSPLDRNRPTREHRQYPIDGGALLP
jgi:hypothetical protein